jgi:CheY-like chemotaxis protein
VHRRCAAARGGIKLALQERPATAFAHGAASQTNRKFQVNTMNAVHKLDRTTIVLVEDDPQSRASLASLLESEGARVVAVGDAETGVEAVLELLPDAVVCDLDLPAMDGFYLIQRLRDHEIRGDHAPTVAVALTGHTDETWRLRSIGEGFQHFMTKPAKPEALVALLSDAIEARQSL